MTSLLVSNETHNYFRTFSVAGARLVHLQYNAGHIYVGGGHAEIESLRIIRAVRVPGRGGALHLHRAVVLIECDTHVAVLPLVLELKHWTSDYVEGCENVLLAN